MSKKAEHARVQLGSDVATEEALIERAAVVGEMAPKTALYTSDLVFKSLVDEFVAAGVSLAAAHNKVVQLEAELAQARGDRDQQRFHAEDCHGTAAKSVEKHSKTSADVKSYGFVYLEIIKTGAVVPTGILASCDIHTKVLDIHVRYPAGMRGKRCVIEISPDPVGPSTYHRLDGDGTKRSLSGYAPGTYWIRAATTVAGGRGDWFGPVAVVVT